MKNIEWKTSFYWVYLLNLKIWSDIIQFILCKIPIINAALWPKMTRSWTRSSNKNGTICATVGTVEVFHWCKIDAPSKNFIKKLSFSFRSNFFSNLRLGLLCVQILKLGYIISCYKESIQSIGFNINLMFRQNI